MLGVETFSLQSGSNGNSIYVEGAGIRLLFDAGISGKTAEQRMAAHARDIREVDALIISHEHGDHIRNAGIYQRMFGLPIYITRRTHQSNRSNLGRLHDVRYFRSGETISFGRVAVQTIPTPHDVADNIAFVIEAEKTRLGIFTDIGHVFDDLRSILSSVDAAYLESNYDQQMLKRSAYPEELKRRIRGGKGHLSNHQAADLLKSCGKQLPRWIAISHLSEDNNHPQLATEAQYHAVGKSYPVHHASRYEVSDVWTV